MRLDDPLRPRDPHSPEHPALVFPCGRLGVMPAVHVVVLAPGWRLHLYVQTRSNGFAWRHVDVPDIQVFFEAWAQDPEATIEQVFGHKVEFEAMVPKSSISLDLSTEDLGL